ncbi:TetR family transcriptional regulator [Micromonospora avicenniae]|uniref:Transcriptional regulator, TetR family n=1 Tax=Micromonospora avicenniae TaxID=1198245 RepID=A0A1N6Y714_9ACTN|nr:TetR family transcriptional regulator [Micromonospora avicenniae]SIR10357.1 transcriptional regulator, TetR family [Micromonospora avicenniae]
MNSSRISRDKLLGAAAEEFGERGIAGARVERIAAQAGVSKGLVYTHFGSKDELFDAVFADYVLETMRQVPFTAADLPEYAGRLHDWYLANPAAARLSRWYSLERGEDAQLETVSTSSAAKVEAITTAQEQGQISSRLDAPTMLLAVLTLASMWAVKPPEITMLADRTQGAAVRRRAVVEAVRALTVP